jgi:sugar transferase (PEP-CTERM/EpsH1 system associated)
VYPLDGVKNMKIKVLVITYNFLPVNSPGVHRIKGFLQHLPVDRFTATVVTAKNPHGDVTDGRDTLFNSGIPDGTVVHRVFSFDIDRIAEQLNRLVRQTFPRRFSRPADGESRTSRGEYGAPRPSLVSRLLRAFLIPDGKVGWVPFAFLRCLWLCVSTPPDIIFTSSPPGSVQLVGLLLKKTTGRKWVADFRDPFNRDVHARGLRRKILDFLERCILENADTIIANTPGMKEKMRLRFSGIAVYKIQVITNGFDSEHVLSTAALSTTITKNSEKCTITFIGTLYPGMVDALFGALGELQQEDPGLAGRLALRIVGTYSDREPVLARQNGIEHLVEFAGFVPFSETFSYMSRSDLLLVLLENDVNCSDWIPSKIFTYLVMSRPILALVPPGDAADLVRRTRTGLVIHPGDTACIKDTLRRLAKGDPLGGGVSPDRKEIERYERRVLTSRLTDVFQGVLHEKATALKAGKKLHIMHVQESLEVGGMENGIVNLVTHLDPDRFQSSLCCLNRVGPLAERVRGTVVPVFALEQAEGTSLSLAFRLRELLVRERVDIVHTHNFYSGLYGISAAVLARTPRIVHGEHGDLVLGPSRRRRAMRFLAPFVDRFVTVSRELRDDFSARSGIPASRIEAIANGVNLGCFNVSVDVPRVRQRLGLAPAARVIGAVGRLVDVKNYPLLLGAMVRLAGAFPDIVCVIVGDGPCRRTLEQMAVALGVTARFLGERHDVPELMAAMDIFVSTSVREGMSNTILEAMAARRPVVATLVGGTAELVDDGITGSLVPSGDAERLAAALRRLLAEPALCRRMGTAGRERVLREFSLERMVEQYEGLYLRLYAGQREA